MHPTTFFFPSFIKSITENTEESLRSIISEPSPGVYTFEMLQPNVWGALKPSDVDKLWVHVTCAWYQPKVAFANDEKMEPALGILRIPSTAFVKVKGFVFDPFVLVH
ncbi:Histone-lysine n-methyltransferase atx4 [Thalictrum thalictroides]|uniref:Histone-lysine n-methyltransferase atx4 n=1 Tax=Thalictrum thalictroides TaxID=46969 RepID=A0A7J6VVI5_THATH|nr:Histone-lysine n-methyltransferase atx4 [Thalictrum thalictroides]